MNTAELLTTDHMVDDLLPQDQAMEAFRIYSSFHFLKCTVSANGRTMSYQLGRRSNPDTYLKMAQRTIRILHLPLSAEKDLLEIGNLTIHSYLIIKYTGR